MLEKNGDMHSTLSFFSQLSLFQLPLFSLLLCFYFLFKGVLNQALELLLSLPNTVRRSGMSCNHSHYQSFSSTHDVATGRVLIIFAKYYQSVFSFLAVIFQLGVMVLLQQYSQYLVLFLS